MLSTGMRNRKKGKNTEYIHYGLPSTYQKSNPTYIVHTWRKKGEIAAEMLTGKVKGKWCRNFRNRNIKATNERELRKSKEVNIILAEMKHTQDDLTDGFSWHRKVPNLAWKKLANQLDLGLPRPQTNFKGGSRKNSRNYNPWWSQPHKNTLILR